MIPTYLKINRFYDLDLIFGKIFMSDGSNGTGFLPGTNESFYRMKYRFTEIRFRSKEDLHLGHFSENFFGFTFSKCQF